MSGSPLNESSNGNALHLMVDLNKCLGYAQCCFLAPNVFELYGQEALRYHPQPDPAEVASVRRAAASCPVQAITVEFPDGESALGSTDGKLPR